MFSLQSLDNVENLLNSVEYNVENLLKSVQYSRDKCVWWLIDG